jgi:outer membrane lipoprotein-sorting protein
MRTHWLCLTLGVVALASVRAPAAAPPAADDIMRRAEARFQSLSDYHCIADTDQRMGQKSNAGSYRIWFKKPHMLRLRVLTGKERGSEVALDAEGKVRGHKGGILKGIVIGLSRDDPRLRGFRGSSVTEFHWGTFYRKYRELAARPGTREVLLERKDDRAPYEVVLTYPDQGKQMREIYRIDPRLWVMVEKEAYENEVRVDRTVFREITLDCGLQPQFFKF